MAENDQPAIPPWAAEEFLGDRRARAKARGHTVGVLVVGPLACVLMGILLHFSSQGIGLMALIAGLPIAILALVGERIVLRARVDSMLVTAFLQALFYAALVTLGLWLALAALELARGPANLRLLPEMVAGMGRRPALYAAYLIVFFCGFLVRATSEVSKKVGPKMMVNWLKGYYLRPREEARVFMFLDLCDSTTLAEQLGHLRYSALVRDCFADLTNPLFESDGEVMHYVGDEAVISWHVKDGLRNAACLRCYFHFAAVLESRRASYLGQFGCMPRFKAGLHFGPVVATEVGQVKSEIVFHGDVLNTTARIRSLCRDLGSEVLVSRALADRLPRLAWFQTQSVGKVELKGRAEKIELCRVDLCKPDSRRAATDVPSAEPVNL